jgi:Cys-tRNA(Pro) deacylase
MDSFTQTPEDMNQFLEFFEEDIQNIRRVLEYVDRNDLDVKFRVHPKAETCEESARHSDLDKGQIVKTLVFRGENFFAVLAPGDSRVDEERLEELRGEDVRMANPDEVEQSTGYVIGGVSPFDLEIPVYMEESLTEYNRVRPAAGSRNVGVEISPEELAETNNAEVTDLTE